MPSKYTKKYPNGRRQVVICEQCKKSFEVYNRALKRGGGKFCSRECKAASQKNAHEIVCTNCNKLFSVRPSQVNKGAKYCSWKCRKEYMRGERHPGWKNDPDYRGWDWKEARQVALRRDGYKCVRCNGTTYLIVHHIIPWPESQDNQLGNLMTLCARCHQQVHIEMNRETLNLAPCDTK